MKVQFDLAIIDQLGEKLYTQLPPILAEYISNSYDADANNVEIIIKLIKKKDSDNNFNVYDISIIDDGAGIADNSKQIEEIFLSFGRKKRIKEGTSVSKVFNRPYHGKKGVGKLAGFGCAKSIEIETTCNGITNCFCLDYNDIQIEIENNSNDYYPKQTIVDENIGKNNGTKIILHGVERSSEIDTSELALRLAARLQIFNSDTTNRDYFKCILTNENEQIVLENSMYYDYFLNGVEQEYNWILDNIKECLTPEELEFFENNHIELDINTSMTPLKRGNGLTIYCRKKMAADKEFFQERHNDLFHTYLYGKVEADFIDEDNNKDYISTERVKINWDKINPLFISGMKSIINYIQKDWREKRLDKTKKIIEEYREKDGSKFKELSPAEQQLCDNFLGHLTNNTNLTEKQVKEYTSYVEDMFEFQSFQEVTKQIMDENLDGVDCLNYIKKWQLIESKELAKVFNGRLEAITFFEKIITNKESETKKIQPFLEKWPWLLDPSLTNFEREKTYEKELKEHFPNDELDNTEVNRRLDFYCVQENTGEYVVIELKRPGITITKEILDQVSEYNTFIKSLLERDGKNKQSVVRTILVMEPKFNPGKQPVFYATDNRTQSMKEALVDTGRIIIKTYSQLIKVAKESNEELLKIHLKFAEENKEESD